MNGEATAGAETKKAIKIGTLSILVYLISYVARNILSVVTPIMTRETVFTAEYLGRLSSIYLFMYAAGQLINGFVGDIIKPKYMIAGGCLLSGAGMLVFPLLSNVYAHYICFAFLGFGLSALRGPLMKIIGENTLPKAAQRICVLFSAASFAGPMIASLLSCILCWQNVFFFTALFAVCMAVLAYIVLTVFERNGILHTVHGTGNTFKGIGAVFKAPGFWVFMVVAVIVEIVASSVNFWIPTYLIDYLGYSSAESAGLYSFIALVRICAPFIAVFFYQYVIKNRYLLLVIFFSITTVSFLLLPLTHTRRLLNVALIILAKISSGCASTMLWSIYIPSLAYTGKISTANGIFDLTGYLGASAANLFFSTAVEGIGWSSLAVVWAGIAAAGIIPAVIALFGKRQNLPVTE